MDPRFKGRPVSDAIWNRLRKTAVEANVTSNNRAVRGADRDRAQATGGIKRRS